MTTAITPQRLAKIEKMFEDVVRARRRQDQEQQPTILEWVEENLWISPKHGGLIQFVANRYQRDFFNYVQSCLDNHRPIRIVILKSRQLGISTAVEALLFYLTYWYTMTNALVVAHRKDSARKLYLMVKRFYQGLPSRKRRPLQGGRPHRDDLEYAPPHSSHYHVLTAGGDEIGRGWTLQFVHASEVAFYTDAEGIMTALGQAVPKPSETSFSCFILESTANGLNLFKNYWDLAQDKHSDWTPIFYSWRDDPECIISIGPRDVFTLDKEEDAFRREHGLSLPQMRWARQIREDQCLGSWARFNQEYPVNPVVAFTSTGWPVFRQSSLNKILQGASGVEPVFTGDIEFLASDEPHPLLVEGQHGPLTIWEIPRKEDDYFLGVDTSEGIGSDYSEIVVLRKRNPCVVAHYRSNRIQPQEFGVRVWLLGQYYLWALVGVERNTIGQVVLGVLEHGHGDRHKFPLMARYPHLYYDTRMDTKRPEETDRLGFRTSRASKGAAIARLAELIADEDLVVYSIPIIHQLLGFTWNPETRRYHQLHKDIVSELYNDDGIMALAIANEMRLHQFEQRFMPRAKRGDF